MLLELLAPAKNVEQGTLALRCGADAVYMGPSRFGARQAAACDLRAFERLCREARLWGARVYATLNTILFDDELDAARKLAWDLYDAAWTHSSFRTWPSWRWICRPCLCTPAPRPPATVPEKVAFLANSGFSRAILAVS